MTTSPHFDRLALAKMTAITATAFALALPAHAADLSTKAAVLPATYNWTGAYVGVNFGFALDNEDVTTLLGIAATNPSGVLGGLQFGYNYQFSTWLLGIEGELGWTSAAGTANFFSPAAAATITSDHNWYDTLSGRLGYVMGPLLIYAKGGGAWMNADYRFTVNSGLGGATSISSTRTGWNAGAGLEYMLTPRWSAKLEYDYLDFGSTT